MPVDRVYPLVPGKLPDGRTVWEERGKARDVLDAIRAYDPRYSLVRNHDENQWEIWRANETGPANRSMIFPGEPLPHPSQVLDWLFRHDLWRGYDPVAELDREDRLRELELDKLLSEIAESSADRMHYELVDEFSSHMPAARPMYLGHDRRNGRTRVQR